MLPKERNDGEDQSAGEGDGQRSIHGYVSDGHHDFAYGQVREVSLDEESDFDAEHVQIHVLDITLHVRVQFTLTC